ncbi:MAG: hypothetical protein ACI32C_01310, partial [Candidatus Enteromonas sp.]
SSSSGSDLILPGKDRIWWCQGFGDDDEAAMFLNELNSSGQNEHFNFGLSSFALPENYALISSDFWGHIDNDFSHSEDIFNSTYDRFWIRNYYNDRSVPPPNYHSIELYFYPFVSDLSSFENDAIECSYIEHGLEWSEAIFTFKGQTIIRLEIPRESKNKVDSERVINELRANFRIVV